MAAATSLAGLRDLTTGPFGAIGIVVAKVITTPDKTISERFGFE